MCSLFIWTCIVGIDWYIGKVDWCVHFWSSLAVCATFCAFWVNIVQRLQALVAHISALYWIWASLIFRYRYWYMLTNNHKLFIYFGHNMCVSDLRLCLVSFCDSPFPSCVAFCDISVTVLHYYAYLIPGQVWNPGFDPPPRSLRGPEMERLSLAYPSPPFSNPEST